MSFKRVKAIQSMNLKCVFRLGRCTIHPNKYTCVVTSALITKPETVVQSIEGDHIEGKSNRDVEAIAFRDAKVEYFPRGLNTVFPHLKSCFIRNCSLKKITKQDLVGLENLTSLGIVSCKVKSLPDDLLENMKQLKHISFEDNQIERLSSRVFQPVLENNLALIELRKNKIIDDFYGKTHPKSSDSVESIEKLMKIIDKKYKKRSNDDFTKMFAEKFTKGFEDMWSTGKFSDFTIVVGNREFRVHKSVLAIQSSVFAAIFETDSENSRHQMTIEDFSVESVEEFLRYFYTGVLPEKSNNMEIYSLSAKFKISNLKSVFKEDIIHNLDSSTAIETFSLGHLHDDDELKLKSLHLISCLFPDHSLNIKLIENPEKLKMLIDAKQNYEIILKQLKT